ncbi:CoA transferase [Streptomyces sp. 3214.6]|uniref:CoA transferase n=1 Tax=Streptomyces sp. 3214.6 TaxID=1882757 RepID=UPI000909C67B|nr:CoA transferase [Streptomyces sp. 3214.6]SHH31074.1 CoA-transferase family III [Streptomyces sp. 3214.6]
MLSVAPSVVSLTEKLESVLAHPATNDEFNVHAELEEVLAGVGLSAADAGGTVTFRGADPVLPSPVRWGAACGIPLAARAVVLAKLWQLRGGRPQDIEVDLRVAPRRMAAFAEDRWLRLNGVANAGGLGGFEAVCGFHEAQDGRYVLLANPYPGLGIATTRLLNCPLDQAGVAAAVARWKARDLEEAAAEAGVVIPMLRSTEEMMREAHYTEALAATPLIEITKIGDSAPEPLPYGGTQPLDGIRALGMAAALAGPSAGRALALHGADVLNIWRPHQTEVENWYIDGQVGVRSTILDPKEAEDAARIRTLLSGADVFYANRRPGYLENIGLSAEEAAELRPGIIYGTVSAYGRTGPWAQRPGFDVAAGAVTGIYHREGENGRPEYTPITIINDNMTAWLLAVGITAALVRRAREGGSYRVHVSLTRTALWQQSLGLFDKEYARETAGSSETHSFLTPELFTADTPLGRYQGVVDPMRMSETPGSYRHVLLPRGACRPEWLPTFG